VEGKMERKGIARYGTETEARMWAIKTQRRV
jgi:hypothetical protein